MFLIIQCLGFGLHRDQRDEHLFERDPPVLEGVTIVLHVVVVVVGISEEVIAVAEDIAVGEIDLWQADLRRYDGFVDLLGVVGKGLPRTL